MLMSVAVSVSVFSASSSFSSGRLIDRRVPWQATPLDIIGYIAFQDLAVIRAHIGQHSVDTLFSILSLCSLPEKPHPASALAVLLFYEHVRVLSPLASVAH
jgi:hypothetical protein